MRRTPILAALVGGLLFLTAACGGDENGPIPQTGEVNIGTQPTTTSTTAADDATSATTAATGSTTSGDAGTSNTMVGGG